MGLYALAHPFATIYCNPALPLVFENHSNFFPYTQPKDKWDIPLENKDAHEDDGKLKLTCEFWKPQVQSRWYKDKEELFIGEFRADGTRTKRNCSSVRFRS